MTINRQFSLQGKVPSVTYHQTISGLSLRAYVQEAARLMGHSSHIPNINNHEVPTPHPVEAKHQKGLYISRINSFDMPVESENGF